MITAYISATAALLAIGGAGAFIYRKSRSAGTLDRLIAAAVPAMVILISMTALMKMLRQPFIPWSHNRLAPAAALLHGCGLYGAHDQGAVLSWMYGPLAAIAYLPAVILSWPTAALLAAGFLSILFSCTPLAISAVLGADGKAAGGRKTGAVASFFVLFFLGAALPALAGSQFNIHADAPSLGLAGAACITLLYGTKNKGRTPLVFSAVFLSCAVFTKQNTLPLLFALPLYVLAVRGAPAALRYCGGVAAALLCLAAASWLASGSSGALLSAFKQPLGYPWVALSPGVYTESPLIAGPAFSERFKALGIAAAELTAISLPFVAIIMLDGKTSAATPQSALPIVARLTRWLREKEWSVFALSSLCTVPVALLSRVKLGGYFNSFAITLYFLALAGAMVLAKTISAETPALRAPRLFSGGGKVFTLLMVAAVSVMTLKNVAPHGILLAERLHANPVRQAFDFARAHPGQAYFPHFPLSTIMAEGRLYHSAYGLWDRARAGTPVDAVRFKAAIPDAMRFVCFHNDSRWDKSDAVDRLISDLHFTRQVSVAGMEDWVIFTKQEDKATR